jgi:hypothetical protein
LGGLVGCSSTSRSVLLKTQDMTIKFYCRTKDGNLEVVPNYTNNTIQFFIESQECETGCELDFEDVDDLMEMVKLLKSKIQEHNDGLD